MANPEYTTEELEEQIIDISPDEIEIIPFDITQENVLNYKILNFPIIKGGRIVAGSGDKCFKFDETDGLWLGNADSASAPFKVDMTGALTASSVTITGLDADDITETAAKKWAAETGADVTSAHVAASITSQGALATLDVVTATEVATNAIEEAKIAADAVVAAKIAVAGLDGTSGDVAANHIVAGMLQTNCVTSAKILADAVTAAKINVVGLDGTSGRIVVADATDANAVAAGINTHAVTLIQAGKIVISGATNLDDWGHASDATTIDGGKVYANSITATQITGTTLSGIFADLGTITAGNITINASGYIKGGQTGYNTGAGFWLGYDSTAYKFSIGNSAGNRMTWDGSGLTIIGSISTGSSYTGNAISTTYTAAKCTDVNADQTSAHDCAHPGDYTASHTANNAANYTGASISTGYTAAKCTDVNADQTSAHDCQHPGDYTASAPQACSWLTDEGDLATKNLQNTGTFVLTSDGAIAFKMPSAGGAVADSGLLIKNSSNVSKLKMNDHAFITSFGQTFAAASNTTGTFGNDWFQMFCENDGGTNAGVLELPNTNRFLLKRSGGGMIMRVIGYVDEIKVVSGFKLDTPNRATAATRPFYLTEIGASYCQAECRMDIMPDTDNEGTFGDSTHRWAHGHFYDCAVHHELALDINSPNIEGDMIPTIDSNYELGLTATRWLNVYADNFPASPIKVAKSGIESFKKIKGIRKKNNKYTLETEDMPEEFQMTDREGGKHTELKRSIGITIQTVRELIDKVEALEKKIN